MENNILVKAFKACNGESILVKLKGKKNTNILIDTGYISTYEEIKKELIKIKKDREKLDLLILTHIDNDHINGARKILKDYLEDEVCEIDEIWYNDYFKIFSLLSKDDEGNFINLNSELLNKLCKNEYPCDPYKIGEEEVGFKEANIISDYLLNEKVKEKLNKSFGGNAIIRGSTPIKYINEEVKITIIGPREEILLELIKEWNDYLNENGYVGTVKKNPILTKAFELFYINNIDFIETEYGNRECSSEFDINKLIQYEEHDNKLINRSSISLIIEFDNKKMLFLGDSSPKDYDDIIDDIRIQEKCDKLVFDLIKVSHHGSKKNTSRKFIENTIGKKYLICTNGSMHMHPDLETIIKIIGLQEENKKLIFNYYLDHVDIFIKYNRLNEKYSFETNLDEITENMVEFEV